MTRGYVCIILHAHLPFTRHIDHEEFLEERWFFEGMTESYIPLGLMMRRLMDQGVPARFTMSLSPTLLAMMADEALMARYKTHLERTIELGEREVERTRSEPAFNYTARMYRDQFKQAHSVLFDEYRGWPVALFRELHDAGVLELMTSAATHGYLPLLSVNPSSVRGQIQTAIEHFQDLMGFRPAGFWLPECGYYRGLENTLAANGLRYFIVEAHGLLNADPCPSYGVFAPIRCPSGTCVFGRDTETAKQVWSANEGYPGDPDYREFYRDIGYDLPHDYIAPYIHDRNLRVDTGYKYFRITGRTEQKQPYQPDWARDKAALHAGNFMFNRQKQIEYFGGHMKVPPIIVSPYDAELFGHWWYEGPLFLEFLAKKIAYDQKSLEMITPSMYLDRHGALQEALPDQSSWGYMGFHEVWLNGHNDWMLPWIHWVGRRMAEAAGRFCGQDGLVRRALAQAARETLLVEASDWPFILNNRTSVHYAEGRFRAHLQRFKHLFDGLMSGTLSEAGVGAAEKYDNLFTKVPVDAWRP